MKLTVDANNIKEELGDLFGIFFEDLNHAADGGLYAELIQNRSFEYAPIDNLKFHALTAWEKIEVDGEAKLTIQTGNSVSYKNPHYLAIDVLVPGNNVGVQNLGYNTGIPLKQGDSYYFTCYAKREQSYTEPVTISLRSKEGEVYAKQEITLDEDWDKHEFEIVSPVTDTSARLAITVAGRGKVYLDFVSLFPKDTFKGRRNGLRKDIAEMLAELKPKFMRFPGGCLVHDGSLDPDARDAMYRWKNTIGPVEERPSRRNNWGYNQSLGLGYYEFFQFCEDIHTKPLPVLPGGWDPHHRRAVEMDRLQPWIDDALDLIEFANGDETTTWGKKRIEMGHEEPFGLEYIAIGNEEVGAEFFERYVLFHKAIREKYPEIKIINSGSPFPAGQEYERGWMSAVENGSDLVDEHYYCSPEWFLANHHRYDSFLKDNPKVFLGEYASWGNTYYNALAEASYMIGLERNAHAVGLACYAPMLCNVDYISWQPDLIWFNNHQTYGSANYYVQKLFMNHQGDQLLEIKAENVPESIMISKEPDKISGDIVLATNQSTVEYYDITLTNLDSGEVVSFPSCILGIDQKQFLAHVDWTNYSLSLKAKEKEGFKGFNIYIGQKDEKNRYLWELGAWQNQDTAIVEFVEGRGSCLSQCLLSVEKNREYQLEIKINGRFFETFVDGEAYHAIESKPVIIEPLYCSASKEIATGDTILKVVNVSEQSQKVNINLLNCDTTKVTLYTLEGYSLEAVNDFEHPELVAPTEKELNIDNSCLEYEFKQQSINVVRFSQRS
jgi:alpha-L-arabinofuranosidase